MASKRNTSKRKGTSQTKQKKENQGFLRNEITILATLAVCALLMFSNFGVGGFVGDVVSTFLFGVFGLLSYIVPILIFIGVTFITSNKGNTLAYIKMAAEH